MKLRYIPICPPAVNSCMGQGMRYFLVFCNVIAHIVFRLMYSPLYPGLTATHLPQPLNIRTKTVNLFISIYLKLLSISTVFISYVSYLIYTYYCHFHLYFTCTLHTVYLYHISISHLHLTRSAHSAECRVCAKSQSQ